MDNQNIEMMNKQLKADLIELENMAINDERRSSLLAEINDLTTSIQNEDSTVNNYDLSLKKLDLEQKKVELEKDKQTITWKERLWEGAKIFGPQLLAAGVYFIAQRIVLEFEESGSISSKTGRELHLPKLFGK